jgi:hypothetical protein
LPLFPGSEKLVRTDAFKDGTDGFFVALFARSAGLVDTQTRTNKKRKAKTGFV